MSGKVGLNEILAYAKANNLTFEQAAQQNGLSPWEIENLKTELAGTPEAPVDALVINMPKEEKTSAQTLGKVYNQDTIKDDEYYAEVRRKFNNNAAEAKQNALEAFSNGEIFKGAKELGKGLIAAYNKEKTPENMEDAMQNKAGFGKGLVLLGAAVIALASCEHEDPFVDSETNVALENIVSANVTVESTVNKINIDKLVDLLGQDREALISFLKPYLDDILKALGEQNNNQVLILEFIAEILEKLQDNAYSNEEIINYLAELLNAFNVQVSNDTEFQDKVLNLMTTQGYDIKTIVNLLAAVKGDLGKLDTMIELLNKMQNQDAEFQNKVLNMFIKFGDVSAEQFNKLMAAMQNDSTKLDAIAQLLAKIQNQDEKFQTEVLKALANYGIDITEALSTIIGNLQTLIDQNKLTADKIDAMAQLLAKIQAQDEAYQQNSMALLTKMSIDNKEGFAALLEAIGKNGQCLDAIAQLLAKMQNQDEKFQQKVLKMLAQLGAQASESLTAILEAIGKDSAKLDAIAQLLAKIDNNIQKYGEDGKELGNKILEAINKFGVDISGKLTQILEVANNSSNDGKAIMALLDKVLAKLDTMDANQQASAKAIIEAMANIKIEGGGSGNVDLSSLEKMLSELLELTSKNNGLLEDIDGKMDVINLTIERAKDEILAHMKEGDATTEAILNALNEFKNISTANDKEILSKMDTIINILNNIKDSTYDDTELMSKLDEILAAIKDHNVTVDIKGKVTCECNCGGSHEGILGDLEKILS